MILYISVTSSFSCFFIKETDPSIQRDGVVTPNHSNSFFHTFPILSLHVSNVATTSTSVNKIPNLKVSQRYQWVLRYGQVYFQSLSKWSLTQNCLFHSCCTPSYILNELLVITSKFLYINLNIDLCNTLLVDCEKSMNSFPISSLFLQFWRGRKKSKA